MAAMPETNVNVDMRGVVSTPGVASYGSVTANVGAALSYVKVVLTTVLVLPA
jgi:hypothetical protein